MENLSSDGNIASNLKRAIFWLLVLAVLGAVLYFVPISKKEKPAKTEYTGLELAKKIGIFSERMKIKNREGWYATTSVCKKSEKCKQGPLRNRGGWTMPLGYFELYRATRDENYRKLADKALELGIDYACVERQKGDCYHYALSSALLFGYTNDPKYHAFAVEKLRPSMDKIAGGGEVYTEEEGQVGTASLLQAGHLADYYFLTKEEKYGSAAKNRFEEAKEKAATGTFLEQCQRLLTTVDFYRVFRDGKYLQEAEVLVSKKRLHKRAEEMGSSWDLAFCMEAYQGLLEFTDNQAYEEALKLFAKNLIATFNSRNYNIGGDFHIFSSPGWHEENEKHLGLNMWFMRIFAKMKDSKFGL